MLVSCLDLKFELVSQLARGSYLLSCKHRSSKQRDRPRGRQCRQGHAHRYTERSFRMMIAQRFTLALRVTLSYLVGVIVGVIGSLLAVLAVTDRQWDATAADLFPGFVLAVAVGLLASWPLCLTAVVATLIFPRSVANNPGIWSVAATLIVAGFSYWILPFDGHLRSVGGLAAVVAGICFYCWSVSIPVRQTSS
jgi:hypothetical protein